MKLQLSKDVNGNKTLKVTFSKLRQCSPVPRGFSIQTLGNMWETHRMTKESFLPDIAKVELLSYVKKYGTDNQKRLLGFDV